MSCSAQDLINTAYSAGYGKLSDRDLKNCIVASACLGAGGGGTSGGNGSPVGVVVPTTAFAFYIQADSVPPGLIWEWYGGAWH